MMTSSNETFSELLALCAGNSPVTGEFPSQRPVTRSFDVFFDLRLNKRLSKQSWGWWLETPSPPLWRHRNVVQYHHTGSCYNKISLYVHISIYLAINSKTVIILCMRPANERWRYIVTPSLIGWAHTQNDLCQSILSWVLLVSHSESYITWQKCRDIKASDIRVFFSPRVVSPNTYSRYAVLFQFLYISFRNMWWARCLSYEDSLNSSSNLLNSFANSAKTSHTPNIVCICIDSIAWCMYKKPWVSDE